MTTSILHYVWWSSTFLASASILIMVLLIFRRLRIHRRAIWWQHRKADVAKTVFELINNPNMSQDLFNDYSRVD